MDHQPLRRKYGNDHHPILAAKCALSRPADDVETRTPRHWRDAVSRTIRLVAIESWSCFSLWKLNQRIISNVRTLPSNNPGRRTRPTISHTDPKADGFGATRFIFAVANGAASFQATESLSPNGVILCVLERIRYRGDPREAGSDATRRS